MALRKFEDNGVTYFELYIRCPVCIGQGKTDLPIVYWRHGDNNCLGDIYVGDNASYRCLKCGKTDHVRNWAYVCPTCYDSFDAFLKNELSADAKVVPFQNLPMLISPFAQMVKETGIGWLQRFIENIGDW